MLKMNSGHISEISVADPNRELGRFHLSVSTKIEKSGPYFYTSWNENNGLTDVTIELPKENHAGDSVTIRL